MSHFQYQNENHPIYPKSAVIGFFAKELKNEFETAVVNAPSVFEPLKVYCMFNKIFIPVVTTGESINKNV